MTSIPRQGGQSTSDKHTASVRPWQLASRQAAKFLLLSRFVLEDRTRRSAVDPQTGQARLPSNGRRDKRVNVQLEGRSSDIYNRLAGSPTLLTPSLAAACAGCGPYTPDAASIAGHEVGDLAIYDRARGLLTPASGTPATRVTTINLARAVRMMRTASACDRLLSPLRYSGEVMALSTTCHLIRKIVGKPRENGCDDNAGVIKPHHPRDDGGTRRRAGLRMQPLREQDGRPAPCAPAMLTWAAERCWRGPTRLGSSVLLPARLPARWRATPPAP